MITKMKFITIYGHFSNIDDVVQNYIKGYNIELVPPAESDSPMKPYQGVNPYLTSHTKAQTLLEVAPSPPAFYLPIQEDQAVNMIEIAYATYEDNKLKTSALAEKLAKAKANQQLLDNFQNDFQDSMDLTHLHHTTGRFLKTNYLQYQKFLDDDLRIIFHPTKEDDQYVWGIYFTPLQYNEETAAIFASMDFTPVHLAPPTDIPALAAALADQTYKPDKNIAIAIKTVQDLYNTFDIKKYASVSDNLFSFSGWVTEKDAANIQAQINQDDLSILTIDVKDNPPTLLKNPRVVQPFEFFTKLYGLPSPKEIDPTLFIAITYTLIFGLMFGDVGHGLALVAIGLILKKMTSQGSLGAIIAMAGASAAVFGVLYGSIFGFEDIINPLWRRPMGDINTTLLMAVGLGCFMIIVSILLNMYNSYRRQDMVAMLLGANGLAGLMFYVGLLFTAWRVIFAGYGITLAVVILLAVPLVVIGLGSSRHPFQIFVNLFENLLGYLTNTISFVRIGAFAISHAGMMHIVLQLSRTGNGYNWLVVILGNVLVIAIEGLLVGIQTLRLDFFEMFSRFYTGGGKNFSPTKI